MSLPDDKINWSLVTVTGVISGRIGRGQDGLVRFSVSNENGRFYSQCRQAELLDSERLQSGRRVLMTGKLLSFFDKRSNRHQTAIRALSISVIAQGRMLPVLRQFENAGDPALDGLSYLGYSTDDGQ